MNKILDKEIEEKILNKIDKMKKDSLRKKGEIDRLFKELKKFPDKFKEASDKSFRMLRTSFP